jgi:D-sedoheptulose 7-phosphate isomerase
VGQTVSEYFVQISRALDLGPPPELEQAAEILREANVVYTFGNGACAALAGHMATDLAKAAGLRVVSLVENAALLTAYANDHDYDCVFEQPLRALLQPRDVALGLTASGRSTNVLNALEYARSAGARTIAFTGSMDGTDRLAACSDVLVRAPLDVIEQIEDLHVIYAHVLLRMLK